MFSKWDIVGLLLISWFIALFEYAFQVPANRLGYIDNGGPFNLFELKTLQEVISLAVFLIINTIIFNQKLQWNHILAFALIVLAVYVAYKKR
ncbi:MAG: DMT family protein [bacterium]|nr:DMT family protein [bacterium]